MFIRLSDRIINLEDRAKEFNITEEALYNVLKSEISKESENIIDLCDKLITDTNHIYPTDFTIDEIYSYENTYKRTKVYGAIWVTDRETKLPALKAVIEIGE